jgi:hypothetical protein
MDNTAINPERWCRFKGREIDPQFPNNSPLGCPDCGMDTCYQVVTKPKSLIGLSIDNPKHIEIAKMCGVPIVNNQFYVGYGADFMDDFGQSISIFIFDTKLDLRLALFTDIEFEYELLLGQTADPESGYVKKMIGKFDLDTYREYEMIGVGVPKVSRSYLESINVEFIR